MDSRESVSGDPSFVIISPESSLPSYQNDLISSNVSISSVDLQSRIECLLKENAELKDTLNQNNISMRVQFNNLAMWQDQVAQLHKTNKEKFMETKEFIMKLRSENESLKKELEGKYSQHQLERDKMVLIKERDAFRDECSRLNGKIAELQSALQGKSEEVQRLKEENKRLLVSEEKMLEDFGLRKHSSELSHQSMTMKANDLKSWAYLVEGEADEPLTVIDLPQKTKIDLGGSDMLRLRSDYALASQQLQMQKIEFEKIKKEKLELEENLLRNKEEMKLLRQRNEQLTLSCSEMEILKAQVSVYEEDFKAEREAREKEVTEKEKLAEELRSSRARIKELERLLKSVTENAKELSPTAEIVSSTVQDENMPSSSTQEDSDSSKSAFPCFKCNVSFRGLRQLEEHVEECLELNIR